MLTYEIGGMMRGPLVAAIALAIAPPALAEALVVDGDTIRVLGMSHRL